MSYITKAIKLAKKSGYNPTFTNDIDPEIAIYGYNTFLVDPSFWESLGKGLGWQGFRKSAGDSTWALYDSKSDGVFDTSWMPEYKYKWHKFIDHLAENKDPQLFFKELLK